MRTRAGTASGRLPRQNRSFAISRDEKGLGPQVAFEKGLDRSARTSVFTSAAKSKHRREAETMNEREYRSEMGLIRLQSTAKILLWGVLVGISLLGLVPATAAVIQVI